MTAARPPAAELDRYTGDVAIGGEPDVRDVPGLRITKIAVGGYDNNSYLLECRATGDRLLIDAAAEPDRLLGLVGPAGLGRIVTTHFHFDHWQALEDVVRATGATTLMHPADAVGVPIPTDVELRDGDTLRLGDVDLHVVHLTGHTLGSIALVHTDRSGRTHVWTGDALFPGGVGRTHGEPALFTALLDGVVTRVFEPFGDDTWLYPGHGRDTTVGAERPHLDTWKERGW